MAKPKRKHRRINRNSSDPSQRMRIMLRRGCAWLAVIGAVTLMLTPAVAQEASNQPAAIETGGGLVEDFGAGPQHWTSPEGLSSALQVMLMLNYW